MSQSLSDSVGGLKNEGRFLVYAAVQQRALATEAQAPCYLHPQQGFWNSIFCLAMLYRGNVFVVSVPGLGRCGRPAKLASVASAACPRLAFPGSFLVFASSLHVCLELITIASWP